MYQYLKIVFLSSVIFGIVSLPTLAKGKSLAPNHSSRHTGTVHGADHRSLCQHFVQIGGIESASAESDPNLHQLTVSLVLRPRSTRSQALQMAYQIRDYLNQHHYREIAYPHIEVQLFYHINPATDTPLNVKMSAIEYGAGSLAFYVSAQTPGGGDGNKWHIFPPNNDASSLKPID